MLASFMCVCCWRDNCHLQDSERVRMQCTPYPPFHPAGDMSFVPLALCPHVERDLQDVQYYYPSKWLKKGAEDIPAARRLLPGMGVPRPSNPNS